MTGEFHPENGEAIPYVTATLAEEVVRLVEDVLNLRHPSLPDNALLRDVTGLEELLEKLVSLRECSLALSKGDLDCGIRHGGIVLGALKTLQANLRHLTFQAQRIAAGELDVHVNFLGQFSEAFNSMTSQLKETLEAKDKLAARYKDLSAYDSLTGLYNRTAFLEKVSHTLSEKTYKERCSALIMSDIDHFKSINDNFGHQCGDKVLCRISRLYQDCMRRHDILCRYGGEEFLILAAGVSSHIACKIAQRLCDAVRAMHITWEGSVIPVTASFGICSLPPLGENEFTEQFLEQYIQAADMNLYQAKRTGRNRVVCTENTHQADTTVHTGTEAQMLYAAVPETEISRL